jgi:hypothetical protein
MRRGAVFSGGSACRTFGAIQKRHLLGEHQSRPATTRCKLNRRQRLGMMHAASEMHVVDINDALARHDLVVAGGEQRFASVGKPPS